MFRHMAVALLVLLAFTATVSAVAAEEMDPAAAVEALYAAVEQGDFEAAGQLLADDAVLTLVPAPGGMDGTFVGKDEVLAWYEGLHGDNGRFEFADAVSNGNMATLRLAFHSGHFDALVGGPAYFDGTAIVQDGLVKTLNWVFTPEFMAEVDAAEQQQADAALVERILTEIWTEGNLDLVDELVAEDYVSHTWPIGEGREHFASDVMSWRSDFPDMAIIVDRMVFDGPRAIIFSHYAPLGSTSDEAPPEGEIEDVLIYQVENGQLSDRWYFAPFDPTQ